MTDAWDDRRKALEDEYFRRKEQETLEKLRAEMKTSAEAAAEAAQEATAAAAAGTMDCPRCGHKLTEVKHADIKVDRCTACKGWWLDAGELEQLTTREDSGWFTRFWQSFSSEHG